MNIPDPPNERFSRIRLKAVNTTANGEEMTNSEEIKLVVRYKLMQEDPSQEKIVQETVPEGEDDYHYIVVPVTKVDNAIPAIPRETSVDLDFDLSIHPSQCGPTT